MSQTSAIEPLREAINLVDQEMIHLLSERMRLSKRIGEIKRQSSLAVFDAQREKELLETLRKTLNDEALWHVILPVMKQVLEGSRTHQKEVCSPIQAVEQWPWREAVAYFGKKDTYTSRMADQLCAEALYKIPCDSFEAVMDAVVEGRAARGIVPIENSSTGVLTEVLDLIYEKPVRVIHEAWQRIDHCLIGLPGADLKDIKTVLSHEQPLKQCRRFLRQIGSKEVVGMSSSACVEAVAQKGLKSWAAIGNREAAERHGLIVLEDQICDYQENQTRFVVIEKGPGQTESKITMTEALKSVYTFQNTFSLAVKLKHKPGALARFLSPFATHGINLVRLHSRPLQKSPNEYLFFVDFEGPLASEELQLGVLEACHQAVSYKWLGSYRRGNA